MNIYTAKQIKEWDACTIQNEPITSIALMERAAHAAVNELLQFTYNDAVYYIFCGSGNNGGDGLAMARLLHQLQRPVKVFMPLAEKYSEDCSTNLKRLLDMGLVVKEIDGTEEFPILQKNAVIIDALYGTGLNRPLKGLEALLIHHINQHTGSTISIDIPSGLYADETSIGNPIVKATTTLSFQAPKLAFFMAENSVFVGEWKVLDIGLHSTYLQQHEPICKLVQASFIKSIIKPRPKFSHKYNYGHALLYAGSPGMYGAGIMCAKACLKSGVGLVSIVVEEPYLHIYQTTLPEAICITDWDDVHIYDKKTAIGIGPGWNATGAYMAATKKVLLASNIPVVTDAAALQMIAGEALQKHLPAGSIITPHTGEFDKCFGAANNDFERLQLALQKANKLNIYIVLKGAYTLIATPQGKGYYNSTGNAGMAKAGSGDVLTGILTGLLAQGYSPLHTCLLGVYLHGLSGDLAAATHTQYAMTAMDIIDHIGEAWKVLIE